MYWWCLANWNWYDGRITCVSSTVSFIIKQLQIFIFYFYSNLWTGQTSIKMVQCKTESDFHPSWGNMGPARTCVLLVQCPMSSVLSPIFMRDIGQTQLSWQVVNMLSALPTKWQWMMLECVPCECSLRYQNLHWHPKPARSQTQSVTTCYLST